MASRLSEFLKLQQQKEELEAQLKRMSENHAFKKELEFKDMLEALMTEYGMSSGDVLKMLDPVRVEQSQGENKQRKQRKLKIYKNPETGEVIETRGGNHKGLKSWKDEHGADEVESWIVDVVA